MFTVTPPTAPELAELKTHHPVLFSYETEDAGRILYHLPTVRQIGDYVGPMGSRPNHLADVALFGQCVVWPPLAQQGPLRVAYPALPAPICNDIVERAEGAPDARDRELTADEIAALALPAPVPDRVFVLPTRDAGDLRFKIPPMDVWQRFRDSDQKPQDCFDLLNGCAVGTDLAALAALRERFPLIASRAFVNAVAARSMARAKGDSEKI